MRYFEKISFEQFKKDIADDKKLYDEYLLPKRSTKKSAGYDIASLISCTLAPGEKVILPTGIKSCMGDNEVLMIYIRSSLGFKYNIRLCNQVGIIDSDYYNNTKNEGHIMIAIQNEGTDNFSINKGERFAQGLFVNFLTVYNEEEIQSERAGGMGSTNE